MAEDRNRQIAELETFLAISRQREQRLKATIRSRIADPWAKEKAERELPEILKRIETTQEELGKLKAQS
jgi:hypothetical protein